MLSLVNVLNARMGTPATIVTTTDVALRFSVDMISGYVWILPMR